MSDWKNVQYKDGKMRTSEGGGGGGSSTFAGLEDVSFNNIQNGQVPKYNSTTQKWENADESGGGGTVTDVEVNGTSVVNAQNVAEIKSYKEVTQAEYNALPASKTSDGILYCIKDSAGADGFPPLIYSDEEREVGVWRDGKPLYQRTFVYNISPVNDWTLFDDSVSYDLLVDVRGYHKNSVPEVFPLVASDDTNPRWCIQPDHKLYYFISNNVTRSGYITVQYTKTTDTAGSGTWTTQGGYAHHYSTTEHVIGTWIDGKPIYEIVKPITTTSRYYDFDVSSLNIDFLVDLRIQIKNVNGGSYVNGTYWQAADDYFNYYLQSSKQIITFRSGSGYSYGTGHVILQYTKTTD